MREAQPRSIQLLLPGRVEGATKPDLNYGARWEINPPATRRRSTTSSWRHADRRHAAAGKPVVNQPGAVSFVRRSLVRRRLSSGRLDHALVWRGVLITSQASCAILRREWQERDQDRLRHRVRHDLFFPGNRSGRQNSGIGPKLHDFVQRHCGSFTPSLPVV
jgi:hypothetical protein